MKRWFKWAPRTTAKVAASTRKRAAVPMMTTLEPRIMFDAAIAATAIDVAHDAAQPAPVKAVAPEHDALATSAASMAPSTAAPAGGHAVVFVDARVQDAASLLRDVAPGTEVVFLQAGQDGLQQMAGHLATHPGADSVQIVAHGNQGDLWLGSTYLSADTLQTHAGQLAQVGSALQPGGDILIYACNTAAGSEGLAFVNSLAALSGRDVAASNNRTGAGHDWNLEVHVGSIEAAPVLSAAAQAAYQHELATLTVTSNADSGANTLRQLITNASSGDTITFSSGMTIGLSTFASGNSLLLINKNLTIDGDLNDDGTADVTLDGQYNGRVLEISSGTVALDGLVIRGGLVFGDGGRGGTSAAPTGLPGSSGLGAGILFSGGATTISHSTITQNAASGGGGGSAYAYSSYGGGGGGGFSSKGGGTGGGDYGHPTGTAGGSGSGGAGAGFLGGSGGTTAGGAGGSRPTFYTGGTGATATVGGFGSIGGGGGAGGYDPGSAGTGGAAAGGIAIQSGATVYMSTTTLSNNLGAGGGGSARSSGVTGASGGMGIGAILVKGTLHYQSSTVTLSSNDGVGGGGGAGGTGTGSAGTSQDGIQNSSGTVDAAWAPVVPPSITSATYNAGTGVLAVTAANMTTGDTIAVNKLTLTGEGGTTYTLTTTNVTASSSTAFSVTLNATDLAVIDRILNKSGTSSTGGTTFNLSAADDWDASKTSSDTSDTTNAVTVSNVAAPTVTSATYNASTGVLTVTGTGLLSLTGSNNDIDASKLTLTGEGGSTYTLTDTADADVTSNTSFTLTLSATDKAAVNLMLNKNGTSSTNGTTYNLAAGEDWNTGADAAVTVADTTGNGITVSSVATPTITSATFNASTGAVVVTGSGFLSASGAANDIVANKFTFTGEGGSTYALTDTSNVDITSGTSFTLTLSATDLAGVRQIINKNGTSSTGGTTYNLAAAEDWAAGADAAVTVADTTGNGITASNVPVPAITSATLDASTGSLVVTGTGFVSASGATNDIVANKFTLTGEGGATYTLTDTSNVEITSGTSFTLSLSATDLAAIRQILNKSGTSSTGGTTYNVAAAEDWAAGASAAVTVADTTGNGITVSNVPVPTITSATYDASTGTLVVTGTGFASASGSANDIVASMFTITGQGGSTYTLTDTANAEITSQTAFTLTLSATDTAALASVLNKNGTSSSDATTYNLAAAEDWAAGADAAVTVADLSGNGITVSNYVDVAPTVGSLNGDSASYTEGGSAVLLDTGSDATVSDPDSADFNGGNVTVSIVTNRTSGEDVLAVRHQGSGAGQIGVSGTDITYGGTTIGSYAGGSGTNDLVVSLNGSASATAVQALLHNLTYVNTNATDPSASTRTVRITVDDGAGGTSSQADVTVAVTAVNDAPTASATGGTPTYTENGSAVDLYSSVSLSAVESGQSITGMTFTVSQIVDGASEILSIDGTDVALTNGTSGTTTGSAAVDYAVSVTGSTATVTLSQAAGLSSTDAQTLVDGLTYRNDSEAPDTTSRVVTLISLSDDGGTSNGGVDTTSTSLAATVAISAVNDAPTLSGGPYTLTGTDEDTTSSGTLVSTMLAGLTHGDVDASPSSGIAVTASNGNGAWQYSTDGVTWNGVGSVSSSASLLLTDSTQLRYVPDGANGETATLTFRAWDHTSGTASTNATRQTADTSTHGGTTAYSSGTAQTSITVSSVNDTPVLTPASPTLTGLTDTDVNNAGQTVAAITGASITDADSGAAKGIAITGLVSGNGTWQYSLDGTSWTSIGSVSASSALLQRATDHVRLVPDGVNGTTASITYLAWDQSGATAGQQGTQVDASSSGGSTPFSSASDTASITVTAVNDAPVMASSGGTTAFTESDGGSSVPVAVDSGLTVSDTDNATLASATVTISGNFQTGQDVLAYTNTNATTYGNIAASYNSGTGVLTLTSSGATATLAQWQAALRAVTYTNTSDTPNTASRTISFAVNDGALDSNTANQTVSVASVNDTPVVSVPASIALTEDTAGALTGISFSDADAGSSSVVATLSVGSGALGATSGSGVTVGGTSTAMTLTGTVANINAYIAASSISYTPAADSTSDVVLTAAINDGGSTGSGGAKTDSDTTALQITAVNDRPDISAPASITITEDVAGALTGISFSDVDAGSASVSVTLSAPTGTLTASAGSGVAVSGSGTGTLLLTGSVADLNAFIASSGVSYTTAANNDSNVTLTVQIDDGGNTGTDPGTSGTGSSEDRSTTVTLAVTAVNDAPVHSVPAAQNTDQDVNLVFSTANSNLISIADVDAGTSTVQVTLTATHGVLTLSGTSGLSFSTGSGTNDATLTFTGNLTDVNHEVDGLVFTPDAGYTGAASVQIVTSDQGHTGTGGAASDSDTVTITVNTLSPKVTSVASSTVNGTYPAGATIALTVAFDQAVVVDTTGGSPTLLLETGTVDRTATYVSGSGTNTLTFNYVVQSGDASADLDYASTSALALNGATLRNAGGDDAILTLPAVGSASSLAGQQALVIDAVAPTVTSVSVPANGGYATGQTLDFTVNLSEAVVVDTTGGTPRIAVTLDTGGTVYADYLSGSGTSALVFRLTVASGQFDTTGIAVASSIDLHGGTLTDAMGNAAITTLNTVGSTTGVLVDAIAPTIASLSVPANGAYNAGDVLTVTVNTSEAVTVTGTPRLTLDVGGSTVHATYVSGSGSTALQFQYTVQAGDTDADGVAISTLQANGGTLRDTTGNDLVLTLGSVGATGGVVIDTTAPAGTGIARIDASPTAASSFSYTVTFSEDVSGVDTGDFSLVATGSASGSIASLTAVDAHTYTVLVNGVSGDGTLRLDLNNSGTGINDAAGNTLSTGLAGASYTVDRIAPMVTSVSVPADGTYVAGQSLDFTVNLSEAVVVDTTGGTPRVAVTLDTGGTVYADYLSGSGASALVFRLTVASGQLDTTGIAVASSIDPNGGTLTDATGNAAVTTLNAVGSTTGVLVDAMAPTIASVAVPANGAYNAGDVLTFTVNTSEAVIVTGTPQLALEVGGSTVHATYVSGSGSTALQFQYTVQAGDTDADGIAISALQANGGTLRDTTGNDLALTLNSVGATSGVVIDTTAPTATGITRIDARPTSTGSFSYRVTFSEDVSGVDSTDFVLQSTGHATGTIAGVTAVDAHTYTVLINGVSGEGTLRLDLNNSGTGIADAAGNMLQAGQTGERVALLPPVAALPATLVPAEHAPTPTVIPTPPALPATIHPLESISPVVMLTTETSTGSPLPPAQGAQAHDPAGPQTPLPAPATALPAGTGTDTHAPFVETGVGTGTGLQALPDVGHFSVRSGEGMQITLPASTFTHTERNAQVSVEVRLADGRPLPAWLKFDPVNGTLSGQPPRGLTQRLSIEVIARDQKGHRAVSHLDVQVSGAPASRVAPPPRPQGEPHTLLIEPRGAGDALLSAAAALQAHAESEGAGRDGLSEQFARFGTQARAAERAALLEHARAAHRTA
jgi:trimeric autotransporter adhesin